MLTLKIVWLEDSYDCDDCGPSSANGARVYKVEGEEVTLLLELIPAAPCYEGVTYEPEQVLRMVLSKLGYALEETHEKVSSQ